MTDPKIIQYIDRMCVKDGDIRVENIRKDGTYTLIVPVINGGLEFNEKQTATLEMESYFDGEEFVLLNFPKNLLSHDDYVFVMEALEEALQPEAHQEKPEAVKYEINDNWLHTGQAVRILNKYFEGKVGEIQSFMWNTGEYIVKMGNGNCLPFHPSELQKIEHEAVPFPVTGIAAALKDWDQKLEKMMPHQSKDELLEHAKKQLAAYFGIDSENPDRNTGKLQLFEDTLGFSFSEAINDSSENFMLDDILKTFVMNFDSAKNESENWKETLRITVQGYQYSMEDLPWSNRSTDSTNNNPKSSAPIQKQETENPYSEPKAALEFIFDEEIDVSDDMTNLEGYLWATESLVARLKALVPPLEEDQFMENINFYPVYDLATGKVSLEGHYYLEDAHYARGRAFTLPLSRGETDRLMTAFETYCKKREGISCLDFLNRIRDQNGMERLPPRPLVDRIEDASARATDHWGDGLKAKELALER